MPGFVKICVENGLRYGTWKQNLFFYSCDKKKIRQQQTICTLKFNFHKTWNDMFISYIQYIPVSV